MVKNEIMKKTLNKVSSSKLQNAGDLIYPSHIAIIMDGNGRWAIQRNKPRLFGHRAGIKALKRIVEFCAKLPVDILTVFAFSTENWKRPSEEVLGLMNLLEQYLEKETKNLVANGVKLCFLGDLSALSQRLQDKIEESIEQTRNNTNLTLNIALNYGGRADIVNAAKICAKKVQSSTLKIEEIDEDFFASQLSTGHLPDPELLIRTSAEMRVSNFLLWEIAYSEIWVTPVLWPDFKNEHLLEAISWFSKRDSRFGGINS